MSRQEKKEILSNWAYKKRHNINAVIGVVNVVTKIKVTLKDWQELRDDKEINLSHMDRLRVDIHFNLV